MALLTKGIKKGAAKRKPGYKGGGGIRQIKKQIPGTKPGQKMGPGAKKTTPGIQKPVLSPGGGGTKDRPVRDKPIPGRKPTPGSRVRPGGPGVKKPNRGAQIAAKKKVFAAKRANKLANQKKLAARKRALARKRKMR